MEAAIDFAELELELAIALDPELELASAGF
jgi:hypothetical protein